MRDKRSGSPESDIRTSLTADVAARYACLEKVADDARDALIITDAAGRIVLFSRGASALFGHGAEEMLGADLACLMTEPFKSNHEAYVRHYVRSGQGQILGVGPRVVPVLQKSGRVAPVELSVSEFVSRGERHFIALFRDTLGRRTERSHSVGAGGARINASLAQHEELVGEESRHAAYCHYTDDHSCKEGI